LSAVRVGAVLIDRLAEAADAVLRLDRPADRALSAFFREHDELGRQDRAFVAETVYAVLRRLRTLQHAAATANARRLALAALVLVRGHSVRELEGAVARRDLEWLAAVKAAAQGELPFEVACDLPDWVVARLRTTRDDAAIASLAAALNRPAPLDLRVNVAKAERDAIAARFAAEGIRATPTPYSPWGLRLPDKPSLARHALFLDGTVEVQDEGSQLLCVLTAPRRGEMVADFCAGAGGKTLALGAAMRSSGRLYAFDVSEKRLANLKPRLARSGLSNVHPQRIDSERDPRVRRLAGKVDRVLVDAPCSGLGTLRRNPDLKWRQQEAGIPELAAKQAAILAAASALVKPGGRLVYATCSLLAEENEHIAEAFLAAQPGFERRSAPELLREARVELPNQRDDYLRLLPDVHDTDGFFACAMERVR
jgi:16S rRNA (cytosine967-C5)-methyltransferase